MEKQLNVTKYKPYSRKLTQPATKCYGRGEDLGLIVMHLFKVYALSSGTDIDRLYEIFVKWISA